MNLKETLKTSISSPNHIQNAKTSVQHFLHFQKYIFPKRKRNPSFIVCFYEMCFDITLNSLYILYMLRATQPTYYYFVFILFDLFLFICWGRVKRGPARSGEAKIYLLNYCQ